MSFLSELFGTEKPIIGLLHLKALPGDPLYYPGGSISSVADAAKRDLDALQSGGVDGILITNEFSMPYQKRVSAVTLAAMGVLSVPLQIRYLCPGAPRPSTTATPPSSCAPLWTPRSRAACSPAHGRAIWVSSIETSRIPCGSRAPCAWITSSCSTL